MKSCSSRPLRFFLVRSASLYALLIHPPVFAQSLPSAAPRPAETVAASAPAPAPSPVAPARRSRITSPEIAARLAETAPKYLPPKSEKAGLPGQPAPRENDKPKNGIVRLPDYVVREAPPPTFKYRELLTPSGKLDLAYKRRPGLRIGSLPFFSNNGVALFMLEEDFALERAAELKELAGLTAVKAQPAPVKSK